MKHLFFFIISFAAFNYASAQTTEYHIKPASKTEPLVIRIDDLAADIIGDDGDDIRITAGPVETPVPPEAKGLETVYSSITKDDYAVNPKIQEAGSYLRVTIPPGQSRHLSIKMPHTMSIYVVMMTDRKNSRLTVKHVSSVEAGSLVSHIEIDDTGEFLLSTGGAHPGRPSTDRVILSNIKFSTDSIMYNGKPRARYYYVGTNSASVELSLPDTLKASVNFFSNNDQIISDLNTRIVAPSDENRKSYEGDARREPKLKTINVNGGGININISSDNGALYLKKQKP